MTPFLEKVCATIGARFGCSLGEIIGRSKDAHLVRARRLIWAIARWHNPRAYSTVALGRIFNRDHGTIVVGLQRFSGMRPIGAPPLRKPSGFRLSEIHMAAIRRAGWRKGLRAQAKALGCGIKTIHKARAILIAAGDWPHGPYMGQRPIRNRQGMAQRAARGAKKSPASLG